jgi:hypothetical protein
MRVTKHVSLEEMYFVGGIVTVRAMLFHQLLGTSTTDLVTMAIMLLHLEHGCRSVRTEVTL